MKLRSLLLAGGTAVLLPIGGFALTQSVLHKTAVAESPAVVAQNSPQPGSGGKRGWGNKWQEQLDLSEAQKAQIQKIRDGEKSSSEGLRQQMRAAAEKQRSLMTGDATDEQLRQQYKEMQALRQQASDRRFETMLQIRKVLTPEQRAKAAQLMQDHRGHRRRGGGRRGMEMMSNNLEF
jgi:periplasmic protein CpxP/Spy